MRQRKEVVVEWSGEVTGAATERSRDAGGLDVVVERRRGGAEVGRGKGATLRLRGTRCIEYSTLCRILQ